MTSQDDLTLLKQMYQRGEISDEQYDALRRHVLWGTPLPQLVDELRTPAPPGSPRSGSRPSGPPAADSRLSGSPAADSRLSGSPAADSRLSGSPAAGSPVPGRATAGPPAPGFPGAGLLGRGSPAAGSPGARSPVSGSPGSRVSAAGAPAVSGSPGSRSSGAGAPVPVPPLPGSPRPESGRPESGRPESGRPGSVRAGSVRPASPVLPAPRTSAPSAPQAIAGAPRVADEPLSAPWRADRGLVPDGPDRPASSGSHRARTAYDPGLPPARRRVPVRDRDPDRTAYRGIPLTGDDPAPGDDLDRGEPAAGRRRADPGQPATGADGDPPRRPRQRGMAAVLTSLLLALALAGAGVWWFSLRETGVDPPTYARSVCGSVRDWQQRVDARSSALVRAIPREKDRSKVRSAVEAYYRDLATLTDSLRGAVVGAGAVDVPGGRAYADSLAAAIGDQSGTMRDLAARASRLDVKAGSLFETSVRALLNGAENAVSEITAALARPAAGTPAQLRLALSDEPACAPYVG